MRWQRDNPFGQDGKIDIITFSNVKMKFGTEAVLDGISFAIKRGEFISLLGASGCGKSTSLRIMGDLLGVSGGEVLVDGRPPRETWSKIAYVFQSPRLAPWRNALDNVVLGMELREDKMSRQRMQETALHYLDMVGLSRDIHKYPQVLSGGERQRVALARALAVDPEIILMDEPFSGLDVQTREKMRDEVINIWLKTGKTIIFVTHDIEEALYLAQRIVVFSRKPTHILRIINMVVARPRRLDTDPRLIKLRKEIREIFLQQGWEMGECSPREPLKETKGHFNS